MQVSPFVLDADAVIPPFAWRRVGGVALLVVVVLTLSANRYGYHRDELYFLEAGRHPAWGYADQPPLVPMLARIVDTVAPGSLLALRTPATLAAAAVVIVTALLARRFGGDGSAQLLAAAIRRVRRRGARRGAPARHHDLRPRDLDRRSHCWSRGSPRAATRAGGSRSAPRSGSDC